jgi:hypothetical protein
VFWRRESPSFFIGEGAVMASPYGLARSNPRRFGMTTRGNP